MGATRQNSTKWLLTLFHLVNRVVSRIGNAGAQAGSRRKNFWAYKGKGKRKLQPSARRAKVVERSHVTCVLNLKMVCTHHERLTSLMSKCIQ